MHRYLNRDVDVRVSHIPCINGPSLVLRLLDKNKTAVGLSALGFIPQHLALIRSHLMKPEGIILIVGPTGCGKTTTLYGMLNDLKSISRKIITIEDPVEIESSLMTQVQISHKRQITFGHAVRAFLRHDPNMILIGEIRDQETAREALRAAMTGHKVFATVHANRPVDAILRLNDLGIPYSHLAGNLTMIITQRLLRRLCPFCTIHKSFLKDQLEPYERPYIEEDDQGISLAQGCDQCIHGFKGRIAAAEILAVNDEIETLIGEGDITGIRQYLKQGQYRTLFHDARQFIREGITSIEEAVRVLG